jgi:5-methyltetrahydropteroyltriglutamate--homocysteine methyltransferase
MASSAATGGISISDAAGRCRQCRSLARLGGSRGTADRHRRGSGSPPPANHGHGLRVPEIGRDRYAEDDDTVAVDAASARRPQCHLREVYPDPKSSDRRAAAYRAAIAHLARAGCTYLQLDDVAFAYLCDPKVREGCRRNGDDPDELPRRYASTIDAALAERPSEMTVTMHTCRGNFKSTWVAEGGYEAVAEAMFSTAVDGFFMEFDSERAGGFEPLRLLPRGKTVVLGLITTKLAQLEDADAIRRRIDEAARYVPLERLCLSPQCGFSSTHHGNALSQDDQWRKLELVVRVARAVWGDG